MMAYAKKKLRKLNRKGGIEGLPMELMIIVVVATVGTGILVGWMGNIDEPESIGEVTSSVNQITMTTDSYRTSFSITVTDQSGDGLKGATVLLSGCGLSSGKTTYAVTNENGVATFSNLNLTKTTHGVGYIDVEVSSATHGVDNTLRIPVVR